MITGAFTDPRSGAKISRPDVTRLVEQAAATAASSVSANTDYLLAGADVGAAKTAKAEKLGVTVVDQDQAWRLAGGRRPALDPGCAGPDVELRFVSARWTESATRLLDG